MFNGFIKVAAAVPVVKLADCAANTLAIENMMAQAEGQGIEVVVFPELCITGYSCQDLFHQQKLLEEAEQSLLKLMNFSHNLDVVAIVGVPMLYESVLYNCAAVIQHGKIQGIVVKTFIPNYKEFYEKRWFASATTLPKNTTIKFCGQAVPFGADLVFELPHCTFGVEICEDLWAPIAPSTKLALHGAEIIFNLSASDEVVGKYDYLSGLVQGQSARAICGYVYAGAGFGESSQDVVYGGPAFIAENGRMLISGDRYSMRDQFVVSEIDIDLLRSERMKNTTFWTAAGDANKSEPCRHIVLDQIEMPVERFTLTRVINPYPFVPRGRELDKRCEEILNIQSLGLARRMSHVGCKSVVVGVSGGLDSTLALMVCVGAFDLLKLDRKGIIGITMPGFGTTDRTYTNALTLMKALGVTIREISIREACLLHFRDLGVDASKHDVTYENSQARERTQILMDAANQMNALVVGTGDLSELALGWATYNGDQMSMYGVNASVPKTLVKYLVRWIAENVVDEFTKNILLDVVDTPISPELIPSEDGEKITQKTEDIVGPYELHDFFLYHTLRHGARPRKTFYMAKHAFANSQNVEEHYDEETIKKWLSTFYRRFFAQQYKRNPMPDGPKIGSVALNPRGDWRMPSDAIVKAWLEECESL